jgi:protein-disulfide isomerase
MPMKRARLTVNSAQFSANRFIHPETIGKDMSKVLHKVAAWLQDLSDPNLMIAPKKPSFGFFGGVVLHEQSDGARRWFTVVNGAQGSVVMYEIRHHAAVPGEWEFNVLGKNSFVDGSGDDGYCLISTLHGAADQVVDAYKNARKFHTQGAPSGKIKSFSSSKWLSLSVIAFLMFAYFVSKDAPQTTTAQSQPSVQAVPQPQVAPLIQQPVSPVAPVVNAAPSVPNDAHLSDEEKKAVASIKNSFKIGSGSKSFYIFSDPNCPHCRRLEASLSHLPEGYHAIMVPVAYQTGSKELAAKVLCAKDRAAAWKDAAFSGTAPSAVCANGLAMVEENNKIFESLRLTSTPSFISPSSVLFSGYMTPEQLVNLVKN